MYFLTPGRSWLISTNLLKVLPSEVPFAPILRGLRALPLLSLQEEARETPFPSSESVCKYHGRRSDIALVMGLLSSHKGISLCNCCCGEPVLLDMPLSDPQRTIFSQSFFHLFIL